MSYTFFTGPAATGHDLSKSGEVLLAPEAWGDIVPIHIQPNDQPWSMGRDAFLACTSGIRIATQRQAVSKGVCAYTSRYLVFKPADLDF